MSDAADPRLTIGGNSPPEPTVLERGATLVEHANKWLNERPEITDEDMAGRAQGFWDQLRAARDETKYAMQREKEPHQQALDRIGARYETPLATVEMAYLKIGALIKAWLTKKDALAKADRLERERKAAEAIAEAQRLARAAATSEGDVIGKAVAAEQAAARAEEALRLAEQAPERAQVMGDLSKRAVGLKTFWSARLKIGANEAETDKLQTALLKHYQWHRVGRQKMLEVCLAIAKQEAKEAKKAEAAPPGITFYSEQRL